MEAWPRETIVASGRLGHYTGETCLHLYYLHRLTAEDTANFRHKAREYKDTILDCDWVLAPMDAIDTSYEETFVRIIQYPTAKETVDDSIIAIAIFAYTVGIFGHPYQCFHRVHVRCVTIFLNTS
jgi:hypothetical protein